MPLRASRGGNGPLSQLVVETLAVAPLRSTHACHKGSRVAEVVSEEPGKGLNLAKG
jgi:hypothetical protein